ncbi:MAG TPA: cytochrome c3 family protein [Caulobacteraceae bacterium]|nr:cytochrome c3 family protein [Caulobacteraceae bacterium]
MPQIFTASADTWLRAVVLAGALASLGGSLMAAGWVNSSYITREKLPVAQPVPFSHKHHVGELGLDCRYCHTTVEVSASAGFPSIETCMTCHSQIWTGAPMLGPVRQSLASGKPIAWNRVSEIPDYVFFDHSIHVNRGVPCSACHGRVDQMPMMERDHPFQMRFCLDCHRDPAPRLRPPDQVTRMDWTAWENDPANRGYGKARLRALHIHPAELTHCGICHR